VTGKITFGGRPWSTGVGYPFVVPREHYERTPNDNLGRYLGISEFMLRFMAWLCLKDNALSGSQMCIVTGPRIDLAIALIDRMKKLFSSSKSIAAAFNKKDTM
jgi:hypothetical protein